MAHRTETAAREDVTGACVDELDDVRRRKRVDELTQAHSAYLRELARKLCRNLLDPDDLMQDLFEKAIRAPDTIPQDVNERAWLSRVMHNLFIDKLRRQAARREEPIEAAASPAAPVDERAWWERLTAEQVRAKLAYLPEDQRITFELFAFEGRSYDEIVAQLGIAKATVGTRILRARQRLRVLLAEAEEQGE